MINNLLQLKNSLKKYGNIKSIQYPHDSIEYLLKWNKTYLDGKLEKEEENYTYFASTILTGVLGYEDQIDFQHEYKLTGGKSVDFIILKNNEPYIAIELKGTKTILDKKYNKRPSAVDQAFDYAKEKKSIEWIIVSNYYEYRLYHKNTKENMISFNLDELIYHNGNKEILQYFLLVLGKESILEHDNLTKLYNKNQLIIEREEITKNFYKLYHHTRTLLINQLQNKGYNKNNSIKYSQTILNRAIFICFCEDMGLLPNRFSQEILRPIKEGRIGNNLIWQGLNYLWNDINNGNPYMEIHPYNGGLFREDLNQLNLEDEIKTNNDKVSFGFNEREGSIDKQLKKFFYLNPVYRNLLIICSFNYGSELNVNILGHIFEQSISDIEKLKEDTDNSSRKKQGIYYTPETITTYICENTIIPYLSKKDNNTINSLIDEYKNDINSLEDKLKNIKIIDPACGSGAFLNKSVDIILDIYGEIYNYKYRDNSNDLEPFFDSVEYQKNILLSNIYGVDLNNASVEITKLSLFLKVAQSEDKLPNLDKNIKYGNSLIDDLNYTNKALNWKKEFKEVFNGGGFDIVIGNPPYVNAKILVEKHPKEREYLINSKEYKTLHQKWDLYIPFIEKGLNLLKHNGIFAMIIPYPFLNQIYAKLTRENIIKNYNLINIVDLSEEKIFEDATVKNCILIISKDENKNNTIISSINNHVIGKITSKNNNELIPNKETYIYDVSLNKKIEKDFSKFKTFGNYCFISVGMVLNADEKKSKGEFKKSDLISDTKTEKHEKEYIEGKNLDRYIIKKIRYLEWNTDRVPFKIRRPTFKELYENEKLVINKLGTIKAGYDNNHIYCDQTIRIAVLWKNLKNIENKSINNSIKRYSNENREDLEKYSENIDIKYILAIINSKIGDYFINQIRGIGNIDINPEYLKKIPIPDTTPKNQKKLSKKVDEILEKKQKLKNEILSFHKYLERDFSIVKINKKLMKYYKLSFQDLYKEVKKQYKKISRKETDKLEEEYLESINTIKLLEKEIRNIDKEIDKIAYELYGLDDKEIVIIEGNILI
jgi:type I restriction-modification system DNA methylase subunit